MEKLKPCPFCGGEVNRTSYTVMLGKVRGYYTCLLCHARFSIVATYTTQDAIEAVDKAWNTRAGAEEEHGEA